MTDAPERIWAEVFRSDEGGNTLTIAGDYKIHAEDSVEYIRADLARPKVKPLVWDVDGRSLRMDDTMAFGRGYDWDGYECLRQEGYGLASGYIIWPEKIGGADWSLYGTHDGLFVPGLAGEEAAKAAAQADYDRRIIAALEGE